MIQISNFKERIQNDENLFGPFWKVNFPGLVEAAGLAGWDFALFDMEHATHAPETVENLVRAAENVNMGTVIRVSGNEENKIVKAADTGADCILVPHTSTKEEAYSAVKAAKFHPIGERGMDVFARSAKYGHIPKEKYLKESNKNTMIAIQVEGMEGVNNLSEIIKVEGLDMIFIGPYDLSESMGIPGQTTNPKLINRIEELVNKIKASGKAIGIYVDNIEEAHQWARIGVQFIAFSADIPIFYRASQKLVNKIKDK